MKFFLKYLLPVLAVLWLMNEHPLGAAVAILLCVIRCAFKSRVLSHLFAHFVYDIMKCITMGIARFVFGRRPS